MLFKATAVAVEVLPDLDAEVAIFAERADGNGRRLELQRSFSRDPQDAKRGLDTYCLVTDEGATHYGGVESWRLSINELRLRLDAKASETLGIHREVDIPTSLTPQQTSSLEASLRSILREVACQG